MNSKTAKILRKVSRVIPSWRYEFLKNYYSKLNKDDQDNFLAMCEKLSQEDSL